jgi:hypothetical protein
VAPDLRAQWLRCQANMCYILLTSLRPIRLWLRCGDDAQMSAIRRGRHAPAAGSRRGPCTGNEPAVIARWTRSFASFWYDFIVRDDWRLAIGVVAGLGVTGVLAHTTSLAVWWVAPLVVVVALVTSTVCAGRKAKTQPKSRMSSILDEGDG